MRRLAVLGAMMAIGCLPVAVASASSIQFGGADGTLNTVSEVTAAYNDATARGNFNNLSTLTTAEASLFANDALVAETEGTSTEQPVAVPGTPLADPAARAAKENKYTRLARRGHRIRTTARTRGTRRRAHTAATFYWAWQPYCWFKNHLGFTLWRYNSHWSWSGGGVRVFSASHNEFASNIAWFWSYGGSRYLWASGALNSTYIGRATQGKFTVSFAVSGFGLHAVKLPVNDVHVHGNGSGWHGCTT